MRDFEVHQHAGHDAVAAADDLHAVGGVLREDEALGAALHERGQRSEKPLQRRRDGCLPWRGAQHDLAGDVGQRQRFRVAAACVRAYTSVWNCSLCQD